MPMAELRVPGAPYQAYPTVTPEGQLPRLGVQTDPAQFGANVAGAVQHLGSTLEGVGNELFSRAVAIKDLQDEAAANEASTKFILSGEDSNTKYQLREGKNANPESLEQQTKELYDIRNNVRQGLTPNQQRMFDRQTLTPFRQFVVSSSRHSAGETHRYAIDSEKANFEAVARGVEQNPDSDKVMSTAWNNIEPAVRRIGDVQGKSEQWIQNEIFDRKSKLYTAKATGLAQKKPRDAEAMRKELEDNHLLTQEDANKLWTRVQTQLVGTISHTTAENVTKHPEGPGNGARWTPDQNEYEGQAHEVVSRSGRQSNIDNPELNIRPAPGIRPMLPGGRSMDYMSNNNTEAAKAIEETAKKLGIPLVVADKGTYVHTELPADYDTKTAPAPTPESRESRESRGGISAAEENPTNQRQQDSTVARIRQMWNGQESAAKDQQRQYSHAISSVAIDETGQAAVQDVRQLMLMLQQKYGNTEMWDKLDPELKRAWEHKITAEPRVRDNPAHYIEMYKLANGTSEMKAEFMAHNFEVDRLLAPASIKKFGEMQVKMKANPEGDPRLTFGLSQMNPITMDELGKDKDAFAEFKARFQEEIIGRLGQEGALKLTPEQYREMGNNLAQKIATKNTAGFWGHFGFGDEVPMTEKDIQEYKAEHGGKMPEGVTPSFRVPISDVERAAAKKLIQQVHPGYESTPLEEEMLIYADRHKRLYGGGSSKNQGRMP
jgi:hypothetical protein